MTQSAGIAEPREPLWTPVFTRFFVARAVDLAGTSMTPVALTLSVLQATGSAGSVGAVMTASLAPMLLLLLLGGVTADRLERLTIIRVTAAASTLTLGAMALTLRAGPQLWILMSLSGVSGLLSAFSGPALRSVIAELAPRSRLQEANAVLASARHAAKIVGPALAGLLVATVGGFWALAIDELVSYVMIPLSTALAAPLASLVGTQALVTTCGAGVAAASLLPLASRAVRSVDL